MRLRFFLICFSVLFLTTTAAVVLHDILLQKYRLQLFDQQVRDAATALMNSEINGVRKIEFDRIENILSEELGETRIGKFFIIRDGNGKEMFRSKNVSLLPSMEYPRSPQWITIPNEDKYIRMLNLQLPRIPDLTLQAGIIVDKSIAFPSFISLVNFFFIVCVLAVGLLASWLLTSTLLRPISNLVDFITSITNEPLMPLPPLPKKIARLTKHSNKHDELQ